MRVFCPTHQKDFFTDPLPRISCAFGPHEFDEEFPKDFPDADFWEYCCGCQRFWPAGSRHSYQPSDKCPMCARAITALYMCDRCGVITVDSSEKIKGRTFALTPGGAPLKVVAGKPTKPSCPGCGRAGPTSALAQHQCGERSVVFTTARLSCPFCLEALAELLPTTVSGPPAFPILVASYLQTISPDRSEGRFDKKTGTLVAAYPGTLVLIQTANGSDSTGSHITFALPTLTHFSNKKEFYSLYQDSFTCDEPGEGEVQVIYPAIFDKQGGVWKLKEAGRLGVIKEPLEDSDAAAESKAEAPTGSSRESDAVAQDAHAESDAHAPAADVAVEGEPAAETEAETEDAAVAEVVAEEPVGDPLPAEEPSGGRGRVRPVMWTVGAAAFLLLAVVAVTSFTGDSAEAALERAIAEGKLFAPQGESAYDYYQQLKARNRGNARGLTSSTGKLLGTLVAVTQVTLNGVYQPGGRELSRPEWENTLRMLEWASELQPENKSLMAKAEYSRGQVSYLSKNVEAAIKSWEGAARLDVEWALPCRSLGLAYHQTENLVLGRSHLLEAIKRDPSWAVPYADMGDWLYKVKKDSAAAERYYRQAVERAPMWAHPHAWLADIAMRQKNYKVAVQELQLVLSPSAVGKDGLNLEKLKKDFAYARQYKTGR
ncbi:MAG: hypothetical protein ABW250_02645 [Pyrinomonadaceae bacterium]